MWCFAWIKTATLMDLRRNVDVRIVTVRARTGLN